MNMKQKIIKIFLSFLLIISQTSISSAQEHIIWIVPGAAGGGMHRISEILSKELNDKGWKIDLKVTGNCATAKSSWLGKETPVILIWENTFPETCQLPKPKKDNFVKLLTSSPYYLCALKNTKITLENILYDKNEYSVSILRNPFSLQILQYIETKTGTKLKPIPYMQPKGALISGEVDLYLGNQGAAMQQEKEAVCFFQTSSQSSKNIKSMNEVDPRLNLIKNSIFYAKSKNFSENDIIRLRKDINDIIQTKIWIDYTKRYDTPTFNSLEEELNFLDKTDG